MKHAHPGKSDHLKLPATKRSGQPPTTLRVEKKKFLQLLAVVALLGRAE
jgi:hypothetical protein